MSIVKRFIVALLLTTFIYPKSAPPESNTTPQSFEKFYTTINMLINAKNWNELNKFVHPKYGFYVYDNPGCYPMPSHYVRFDNELRSEDDWNDEVINNKFADFRADQKGKLRSGKVPNFDCGTEEWTKKGCYGQNISSYPDLVEFLLYTPGYDENPNHPLVIQAKEFSKFIKKHVVQTSGYDMYFAYIDGRWFIAVIDLCGHCEA